MIQFTLDKELNKINKTRYWLSKQTGIDNNTLGKIYNNISSQIKLDTLDRIIEALQCEVSDILEYIKVNK